MIHLYTKNMLRLLHLIGVNLENQSSDNLRIQWTPHSKKKRGSLQGEHLLALLRKKIDTKPGEDQFRQRMVYILVSGVSIRITPPSRQYINTSVVGMQFYSHTKKKIYISYVYCIYNKYIYIHTHWIIWQWGLRLPVSFATYPRAK